MDIKTRGFVESMIDDMIEEGDLLGTLEWIQQETHVKSFRDLALGFMIGGAMGTAIVGLLFTERRAISNEDEREFRDILKQRLPQMIKRSNRELLG